MPAKHSVCRKYGFGSGPMSSSKIWKANQFGTETTWKVVRLYENMDRVRFPSFPPQF